MQHNDRIYIAGHRGLVGSAIQRSLSRTGYVNLITRSHADLDLRDGDAVRHFVKAESPDYVFLAAAKVGGILANNTYPADFIRDNLAIQTNVIDAAYQAGVKRLLFLGSSCIYPKMAPQPIKESSMLTGPLEPTNRPYALAKIAGVEMCWSYNRQYGTRYLTAMPSNVYGPEDQLDPLKSHVLPALVLKILEAHRTGSNEVVLWGSGTPRREFIHSDDVAEACVFLLNLDEAAYSSLLNEEDPPLINVGVGTDVTIRELAGKIAEIVGYQGTFAYDASKPDGTPRKLMDVSRLAKLGWSCRIPLEEGLRQVCALWSDLPS